MATKTKAKSKSKKPLTVPRRTNLPKLSLVTAAKPETTKPETAMPETAKPETAKPETAKPETAKPETTKPETVKAEPAPAAKPKPARASKAPKAKPPKPERPSALNAAARVLADADTPMTVQQLVEAMAEQKLWTSPGGKTPGATLHAAISKEIATKGTATRFRKVGRGLFAATAGAADSTPAEVSGIAAAAPELS